MGMKKDFGPFELHEKIGSGGMASVYLGVQKSLDRPVVLKVLYPHLAEDEKLVARFEREARAAAFLRHENIVQVIDCGRHDDLSYIAMEFVEGLNLKQWMETYGPPPLEMALLILRDICRGMEHAHQHRVVHRDIKPANIMLTPDGTIKIMDFGLARRGEDTTAVTVVGSVLGTPAYMSPEQATGETVDERSDIFSAGVVGYELLGGQRPFQGDSYSSVLRAILTVEPPPLESFNPLVPDDVVAIIHRTLLKDLSKRYQGIGLVRGDLETIVEQMGLHRGKDLLREYAQDPARVGQVLRKKRLSRHLDQGLYYENMGLGKIDDALREFRRVLFLDPENKVAQEHAKKLERERERLLAEKAASPADATVAMDPAAASDATLVMPPGGPPPAAPAAPKPAATPAPPARAVAPVAAKPAPAAPPVERPGPRPAAPKHAAPRSAAAGTRNLILAAGGLLITVVVVGVFMLVGGGGSRGSGGNGGRGEAPPPGAAQPVEPPPPVSEPQHATPPPVPEPQSHPPPDGAAAPAGAGTLVVETDPAPAKVLVDGIVQSKRSNATFTAVAAGERVVRVEKDGYVAQEKRVTLEPGGQAKLSFILQPSATASGTLEIRVKPYASYYVDDKLEASNVTFVKVAVKPGAHTVRAVHPAFEPKEWLDVRVEPNRTRTLTHDFLASTAGSIRVTSGGVWAEVYLNGVKTGKTTPCILEGVPSGSHTITLVREGFTVEGGPQSVTMRPGAALQVDFKLRQK